MGLYDIAYMLAVPGMTVTAPKDGDELIGLLKTALVARGRPVLHPVSRATRCRPSRSPAAEMPPVPYGTWETLRHGREVAILGVGTMVQPSVDAAELLRAEGLDCTVVNARFLKPLDRAMLEALLRGPPGRW